MTGPLKNPKISQIHCFLDMRTIIFLTAMSVVKGNEMTKALKLHTAWLGAFFIIKLISIKAKKHLFYSNKKCIDDFAIHGLILWRPKSKTKQRDILSAFYFVFFMRMPSYLILLLPTNILQTSDGKCLITLFAVQ